MQRTKVLAVAAALVAAVTATVLLAGGASAATWHVYEGDVFPGHAYAIDVPSKAESVEFLFQGAEAGSADIGVYAPDGSKVGFYELAAALPAASVANPDAGRYVLYVYDVADGALTIRVNSKAEPQQLELTEVALARQDIRVGEFPQGKLDQAITADLKLPTVFVTLLYEGSAKDLDATVASTKGNVVTITDETATAFSPGVWTSLKGERTFDASNLDGTKYTVEIHATQFEGRMILTTLALDLAEPVPTMKTPAAPPNPTKLPRPTSAPTPDQQASTGPEFALAHETAVAFEAPAGKLVLVDPAFLERMEAEENGEEYDAENDSGASHGMVSIFTPDDVLLATVVLGHDEPMVELDLPVAGEYVAYTHSADQDVVLAKLVGTSIAPKVRVLELEEVETVLTMGDLFGIGGSHMAELELERVPVAIGLEMHGLGALSSAYLENEDGEVASTTEPLLVGTPFSWTYVNYDNLAAGAHTLWVNGVFEGDVVLTTLHYLRDSEVVVEDGHEAHEEHEHEEAEEPAEPEERATPLPPMPDAPVVLDLLRLPF